MKEFKKISILHISDLHKKDDDDFDNLFQSMKDDCIRYVNQGITKPNIIVVSGDLIRGGKPDEIEKQYQETADFLNKLTEYFLDNDKSRIIIVPGNHDVNWNVSKSVMKLIPNDTYDEKLGYNKNLNLYLKEKTQTIRWNWEDQRLYSYDDKETYNTRMKLFSNFYNSFYGNRTYSLEPGEQFDIFDIPSFNICFVGFNSCYLNDHLNKVGQIFPKCVTMASERMKEMCKKGRILVAIWHHNATGRPMVNNYLDNRILNPIIDMGVHIALHGHQHFSGVVEEYHNVFDNQNGKLLMYSTGSLYGASETLSYGASRQYNIMELEKDKNELVITVHLREDNNQEEFGIPNWRNGIIKEIGKTSWKTTLPYPSQPDDISILSELMKQAMESGDYTSVIEVLKDLAKTDSYYRKMMLELMIKGQQYHEIIDFIGNPETDEDALFVIKAAYELNDKEVSQKVKSFDGIINSNNSTVRQMKNYL